jgi:two-component system response regulator HydG
MSRILVVDDETSVLSAFQEFLGGSGHEVATAREAEAALDLLGSEPFDLIVMDICLSGMDGLEALRRIKQRWPAMGRWTRLSRRRNWGRSITI